MQFTMDPPPNPCLSHLLLGTELRALCLLYAQHGAQLYQARVHKDTGDLAAATTARASTIRTRWGERYVGEVVVASDHFLPHEEGWTDEHTGETFAGAHDMNAVLCQMAGLPVPEQPQAPPRPSEAARTGAARRIMGNPPPRPPINRPTSRRRLP
jgi:hypothetical protein